jgi:hypothetical protein
VGRRLAVSRRHHQRAVGEHVRRRRLLDVADPTDPDYIYAEAQGGYIGRVNRKTHEVARHQAAARLQGGQAALQLEHADHISPTQKGTIYIGAQFLFRSRDHGQTWERISPDLTTNDPEKQKQEQSGGVTVDNSRPRCTRRSTRSPSRRRTANVIWVGHRRRQPAGHARRRQDLDERRRQHPGLPKNAWVSYVDAGHFDDGHGYAPSTCTRSATCGRTSTRPRTSARRGRRSSRPRTRPVRGYAHVIKEDLVNPTCSSSARSSGSGSRSTAASSGRSTRAAIPERRGARPRDSSARQRPRHRHARPPGSSTTSRRCARSH